MNLQEGSFTKKQLKLIKRYFSQHKHEPYISTYFRKYGLKCNFVNSKTLRPEKSWAAKYLSRYLLQNKSLIKNKNILDMGCGSGIQSIICAIQGASEVHAVDISKYAVYSTKINKYLLDLQGKIKVYQSDLFENINAKFDIIIFNHPYFSRTPSNEIEQVIFMEPEKFSKFFKEFPDYLNKNGLVLMPYSHLAEPGNNPQKELNSRNIRFEEIVYKDRNGKHSIFKFAKS